MDHQEILKQRDLLDAMLASRTNQYEKIECMKVMDSIYFKEQLPENVVLFFFFFIKSYVYRIIKYPNK